MRAIHVNVCVAHIRGRFEPWSPWWELSLLKFVIVIINIIVIMIIISSSSITIIIIYLSNNVYPGTATENFRLSWSNWVTQWRATEQRDGRHLVMKHSDLFWHVHSRGALPTLASTRKTACRPYKRRLRSWRPNSGLLATFTGSHVCCASGSRQPITGGVLSRKLLIQFLGVSEHYQRRKRTEWLAIPSGCLRAGYLYSVKMNISRVRVSVTSGTEEFNTEEWSHFCYS